MPRPASRLSILGLAAAAILFHLPQAAAQDRSAGDAARLGGRPGRRPIALWPPSSDPKRPPVEAGTPINLGGWVYRAYKSANPRDGVPWELVVTPAAEHEAGWTRGEGGELPPLRFAVAGPQPDADALPVVRIPETLWPQWMAADLHDVVGIHYHEYVTEDLARVLYTVHKVPPDNPDGTPPAPGSYPGRAGVRIEATLLAPLAYHLDQTITVRDDKKRPELPDARAQHEIGHAQVSAKMFLSALAGPQDWNLEYCSGRRSRLAYYWKRERIGRSWDGYRNGIGKMLTLRTTVVLVPPTRWSVLLAIPPERLTDKHVQAFNDAVVQQGASLARLDQAAQSQFHAHHGEYEAEPDP